MSEEKPRQSYWCNVPAHVLSNKNLSDSEKLLYAIISSLTELEGYCWASNKYLSEIQGCTEREIKYRLEKLEKLCLIKRIVEKKGMQTKRMIYLNFNYEGNGRSPSTGNIRSPSKGTSVHPNNKVYNNKDNNKDIAPNGAVVVSPSSKKKNTMRDIADHEPTQEEQETYDAVIAMSELGLKNSTVKWAILNFDPKRILETVAKRSTFKGANSLDAMFKAALKAANDWEDTSKESIIEKNKAIAEKWRRYNDIVINQWKMNIYPEYVEFLYITKAYILEYKDKDFKHKFEHYLKQMKILTTKEKKTK